MSSLRLIFMGTPQFAVPSLKALHEAGYTILQVVTQPDRPRGRGKRLLPPPVKVAAEELNLPIAQPTSLRDPEVQRSFEALQPDVICVVAYGALLPPPMLEMGKFGCVNVHPSLLPKYRGAAPIQRALIEGEVETGVTTMFLAEEMDAGDIILQVREPIRDDDDAGALHDRLSVIGADLLVETLRALEAGTAPRIPQRHEVATYAPKIERDDEPVDWQRRAQELHHQIRGLSPRPGAYTYYGDRRLKLLQSRWSPGTGSGTAQPGEVVGLEDEAIQVQTGDGILHLVRVQPENSKPQSAVAFINGHRLQIGERLGLP